MANLEYSPDRAVDLYGDPGGPTVLLWHGMQPDARASVRTLAEALAEHGVDVVVPDWDSHAADRGRSDLVHSATYARTRAVDAGLVLVGWSMGGAAAADLTLHATYLDIPIAHTICLAGAFTGQGPISGTDITADISPVVGAAPFLLLHGRADDVVPVAASKDFAAALTDANWPANLVELDADHASIAGARYDAAAGRYDAADDAPTSAVAADVAARIAAVAH